MADCLVQAYSNPAIIISKILGGGRIINEKTVSQKGQKEINQIRLVYITAVRANG